MGILNGSIFEDQYGKRYRYTGEDDGVPDYNDPTTFEEIKAPIQEQTEEVLDEPSAITDLGRVAYNTVTSLPNAVGDLVGSVLGVSEEEVIDFKKKMHDTFINDLSTMIGPGLQPPRPRPELSKDTPEGRERRKIIS